jgi:hypothetical protein
MSDSIFSLFTLCTCLHWFADFQISNGFLMTTYNASLFESKPEDQPNNPADFVSSSTLESIYLVKPKQASLAVLKFSGTLEMHNCPDRQSATIMAFSHFVLENSASKYMFIDIQGKFILTHCIPAYQVALHRFHESPFSGAK